MARKTVHITPNSNNEWNVKRGGVHKTSIYTGTKANAIKMGYVMSKCAGCEIIVHGENGQIQHPNGHGKKTYSQNGNK